MSVYPRLVFDVGVVVAGALLLLVLWSCASTPRPEVRQEPSATGTKKMPWWVASPSAPLPKDFPEPSPPGEVVIKQYPSYRAAVMHAGAGGTENSMFYPLFKHIKKSEIPMSSPVELTYKERPGDKPAPESMAFLYGDPQMGNAGSQGPVQVVDVPAVLVASLGVTGSYTAENYQQALQKLLTWLREHEADYRIAGQPRFLAYNSPFVLPAMRLGEVQVPVVRKGQE